MLENNILQIFTGSPEQLLYILFFIVATSSAIMTLEIENIVHAVLYFTVFLVSISLLLYQVSASYVAVFVLVEFVGVAVLLALFTIMITYKESTHRGEINRRTTIASALFVTGSAILSTILVLTEYPSSLTSVAEFTNLNELSTGFFSNYGVSTNILGFSIAIVLVTSVLLIYSPAKHNPKSLSIIVFGQGIWLSSSLIFFSIGLYGLMSKRNVIKLLFSAEIITAAALFGGVSVTMLSDMPVLAQSLGIFITTLGAIELIIGITLVYLIAKELRTTDLTKLSKMRG